MALSANCLTTVATLESELGISAGSDTTACERIIEAATKRIENYCNRIFKQDTAVAEYCKGHGTVHLCLKRPPLVSITSITFDGAAVSSDDYSIMDADAGILYNAGGWHNTAGEVPNIERDSLPGSEDILYLVTYKGGWVTPAGSGTRDLPYDLEQACLDLACTLYRGRGRNRDLTSERLMSAAVTYRDPGKDDFDGDLPPSVKGILNQYRRIAIA